MNYLDRQLCEASNCSNFETCYRALTPERLDAADRWWKSFEMPDRPIPISYFDFKDSQCFNPKMDK